MINFDKPTLGNIFTCVKELENGDILVGGVLDTLQVLNISRNDLTRITRIKPNGSIISNHYYNYKTNDAFNS
jgi:hypothetical protein